MNKHKRVAYILLSGGMDSAACIAYHLNLNCRVRPIFIDYGQPARMAELRSARAVARFYKLDLRSAKFRGAKIPKSGEIVGRNSLLLSAALIRSSKRAELISIGIHSGTRYFDCHERFAALWQESGK